MSRHLLICTLGASWAVIPEVYAFLAPDRLPLYRHHPDAGTLDRQRKDQDLVAPDEIWVCTTLGKATQAGIANLQAWQAQLPAITLRIWQANATDELASPVECERFRELLLRVCLLAHDTADGGQVTLSLAGGRKTMSADLQWAGSLLGCQALIHVVGLALPEPLLKATPALMGAPLPPDLARCVMPVVTGDGRRSELLDVDLDGAGPVTADRFPVPLAKSWLPLIWSVEDASRLIDELRRREQAGSQLLGNFLESLAREEHHENWRSLYRLPPRLIEYLRETELAPVHREWLVSLPKADLHRHLGGCLSLADQFAVGVAIWDAMAELERKAALDALRPLLGADVWPWDWPSRVKDHVPRSHAAAALLTQVGEVRLWRNLYTASEPRLALRDRPRGFSAYERPGELSGSALLGHPVAHRPYASAVVRQAVEEGLAYLELRGSPQKYGNGLCFLQSFHAALAEALLMQPAAKRPRIRFVLIADRRDPARAREVIELALAAQVEMPDFIAGLDLAGDERETPPSAIARDFLPAFEACLPLTIHAGEGEAADAIWQAAYHLHADRIGHGLTLGDHPQLAARFRDRGICLELCPSSNREVVGFRDPDFPASAAMPVYPLRSLWDAGLPLTLCTDNPGISQTTLVEEYLTAARMVDGLSIWDALAMMRQAFIHAFLPSAERERLLKRADAEIYRSVLKLPPHHLRAFGI